MKKITLILTTIISIVSFAQQKSTGTITLSNNVPITANFTLDNSTSQVTLVLTGPSDRWFGLGIGVVSGFGMDEGDVVVFTTTTTPNLTDRNFVGTVAPAQDAMQSWTTVSNTVIGNIRTLTLTRALTNSDTNDFQMPYATTNSISIGGVRASSANMNVGSHGGSASAGYAVNVPFQTLGVEDFSLNASKVFPNPSQGDFTIQTKTFLNKVNIYTQTGAFVKSIEVGNNAENVDINIRDLQTGVYLLELVNDTQKSWKKVIVN
jgi:hypothetical protein